MGTKLIFLNEKRIFYNGLFKKTKKLLDPYMIFPDQWNLHQKLKIKNIDVV